MAFFREVGEDIRNIVEKDPAARNGLEVLICYPGIWALILHRPAHWLYKHNVKLLARIISQLARWFTGIEILNCGKMVHNMAELAMIAGLYL